MFDSSAFWLLVALTAIALHALGPNQASWRAVLLTAASLGTIYWLVEPVVMIVALLVATIGWASLIIRLRPREGTSNSFRMAFLAIAPILALWVVGKEAVALEIARFTPLLFVGLSFFLVKAWTFFKDYYDGRFERPPFWTICAYFLHFPTYVSGPIHYFDDFAKNLTGPLPVDGKALVDSSFRILLGLFKIKVLVPIIVPFSLLAQNVDNSGVGEMLRGAFVYSFVLLFDFSGYSDLAIAVSRLFGIATPENFRWPYLARNIREFWQRWHISFTRVLTGYVFVPLTRVSWSDRALSRSAATAICYGLTFAFCGYWHGATLNFVAWGLYHALGLTVYDLWNRKIGKRRALPRRSPAWAVGWSAVAISATFAFVSIGWILFVFPLAKLFS